MINPLKLSLPLACAALLAACSSGSSSLSDASDLNDFADRLMDAVDDGEQIAELPNTAFDAVPTSGSATFSGAAGLLIDPVFATDDDDIVLVGDAEMTANFSAGTLTGSISNIEGATNATETSADILDVSGDIAIGQEFSVVGDDFDDNLTNRPNEWLADYNGDLTIDGDNYLVEGTLEGQFVGTRVNPAVGQSPIRGIIGEAEDGVASINGNIEEVPAVLEVFGENG